MKSLISTFNCSLLRQTFPIYYLASVKYLTVSVEVLTFQQALIWAMISVLSVRVSNATAFIWWRLPFLRSKQQNDNGSGFTPAVIEASVGINRALHAYSSRQQMMSWWLGSRKWRHQPGPYLIGCLSLRIWEKAPRGVGGGGRWGDLAVQSIPHHSSLFTCLPVSTPGSLSNLSCPPSRRPPLFPPTQSEDTLPPPLSHSHTLSSAVNLLFTVSGGLPRCPTSSSEFYSLLQVKEKNNNPATYYLHALVGFLAGF